MGRVGKERILSYNRLQMGVFSPPKNRLHALRSESFLVAPSFLTIGSGIRGITIFWSECSTKHVMNVGDRSIAMMRFTAMRAVDRRGEKHAGSVYGKQDMIVDGPKPLQNLPPLQLGKDGFEYTTQIKRIHFIKTLAHPRITGHTVPPKETLPIGKDRRGTIPNLLIKFKQRGALQMRKSRHQGIHERTSPGRFRICNLLKTTADRMNQMFLVERFT